MGDEWREKALCDGADPEMFFTVEHFPKAREVCAACPVRLDCLHDHMREPYGMFGGLTPYERELVRRRAILGHTGAAKPVDKSDVMWRQFQAHTTMPEGLQARCLSLYENGLSVMAVSEMTGAQRRQITRLLKAAGVLRSSGRQFVLSKEKDEVIRRSRRVDVLKLLQHRSNAEVASITGYSERQILRIKATTRVLKRDGITDGAA